MLDLLKQKHLDVASLNFPMLSLFEDQTILFGWLM